jgi:hypothetical protein
MSKRNKAAIEADLMALVMEPTRELTTEQRAEREQAERMDYEALLLSGDADALWLEETFTG